MNVHLCLGVAGKAENKGGLASLVTEARIFKVSDKSVLQLTVKPGCVDRTCVPTSNTKLVKLVASKVHLKENLQFFTADVGAQNLVHYTFVAVLLGKWREKPPKP